MEQYAQRKYVLIASVILVTLIFLLRLLYLQVIDPTYKLSADSNTRRLEVVYPARGLIYDREHRLVVTNQPTYDLKIVPYELESFDSIGLCDLLGIDLDTLRVGIRRVRENPALQRNPFIKQVSPEVFGKLKEQQYKFPGFYFSQRTLRKYNYENAAHLLGYVGEVDSSVIKSDSYYESGDYYGVSGVEKMYETYLRGEKGKRYRTINVHGRDIGAYLDGKYDIDAKSGSDLILSIDAELQAYGEQLMQNYIGSIVAIEPSTGEVLALVTAPSYNPSLLVGRKRISNYKLLKTDTLNPLFNYAIMAMYPPGSTFKPANALVGEQNGTLRESTSYYCDLGYYARGVRVGCHNHESPLDLSEAIQHSCNAYFCYVYKEFIDDKKLGSSEEGYMRWRTLIRGLGFGASLGIDLPYEKGGFIPHASYYDRYYGRGYWKANTIISNSIGQGEILTTPLQLANFAAIVANRGYYIRPHVIKHIIGVDSIPHQYTEKIWAGIDTAYFEPIIEGMDMAVNKKGGTALSSSLRNIVLCGKTGTAQNPHGKEHSVFIAFAPRENPKIAIAVIVEHGEWGASYAAPISSLMVEKYLTDSIAPYRKWLETKMLTDNLISGN